MAPQAFKVSVATVKSRFELRISPPSDQQEWGRTSLICFYWLPRPIWLHVGLEKGTRETIGLSTLVWVAWPRMSYISTSPFNWPWDFFDDVLHPRKPESSPWKWNGKAVSRLGISIPAALLLEGPSRQFQLNFTPTLSLLLCFFTLFDTNIYHAPLAANITCLLPHPSTDPDHILDSAPAMAHSWPLPVLTFHRSILPLLPALLHRFETWLAGGRVRD